MNESIFREPSFKDKLFLVLDEWVRAQDLSSMRGRIVPSLLLLVTMPLWYTALFFVFSAVFCLIFVIFLVVLALYPVIFLIQGIPEKKHAEFRVRVPVMDEDEAKRMMKDRGFQVLRE